MDRRCLVTCFVAIGSIALPYSLSFADTVNIGGQSGNPITQDVLAFGWVRSDNPNGRPGEDSGFIGGVGQAQQMRGYMTLDLSYFTSKDKIKRATLSLFGESSKKYNANGSNLTDANAIKLNLTQLEAITGYGNAAGNNAQTDKDSRSATWDNINRLYGSVLRSVSLDLDNLRDNQQVDFDVTELIAAAVTAGEKKITFGLTSPEAVATNARNFFIIKGVKRGSYGPNLRVDFVPAEGIPRPRKISPQKITSAPIEPDPLSIRIAQSVQDEMQKNSTSLSEALHGKQEIPVGVQDVFAEKCLECHDSDSEKGGINLDLVEVDWANPENYEVFHRALKAVEQGLMPPIDKPQLTSSENKALVEWLDDSLLANTDFGGQLPRRLSQTEYLNTIRSLTSDFTEAHRHILDDYKLPAGFPNDAIHHGFDKVAAGLVTSPPLLESYSHVAQQVADLISPKSETAPDEPLSWEASPDDLVVSFSASKNVGDSIRLASRHGDMMRSCSWPSRIEVPVSGTYRIGIDASQFIAEGAEKFDGPMILEVRARPADASERSHINAFRVLTTIEVTSEESKEYTFDAELYQGETLLFRWENALMTHGGKEFGELMEGLFERDPAFLSAWQKTVFPDGKQTSLSSLRGLVGWNRVAEHWKNTDQDLSEVNLDSEISKRLLNELVKGKIHLADCMCHYYFNHGPSLEIHRVKISGPSKVVESPTLRRARLTRARLFGEPREGQSFEDCARAGLPKFLQQVFRRPVDDETVESYVELAKGIWDNGGTWEEGVHLLIRNVLISPRFLYRAYQPGKLDEYDLASRLSYFLTEGPPDSTLLRLAAEGKLSDPGTLQEQALRLLPRKRTDEMITNFTSQWLDTRLLSSIMPDPKFKFSEEDTRIARLETEAFFTEILVKNLPMTDFIDPDFTHTRLQIAERNYRLSNPKITKGRRSKDFTRISIDRGGWHGGLLGQASVLMATANGVDTQPVLRGVWVLENLLGMEPPPPPKNVPALTPDTRGATTPRELLAAHTEKAECAGCHQLMDPLGFVLESFDPVGRWRETWPKSGKPIDTSATLPDGTEITDVRDLKKWMVKNIDQFSECLAEKLMIYATGKVPNYMEKHEIKHIVDETLEQGGGFRDLLLALIQSETFRTR